MHAHMHARTHTDIHTDTHINTHTHNICRHACMCAHAHTRTCARAHTHTHTHTQPTNGVTEIIITIGKGKKCFALTFCPWWEVAWWSPWHHQTHGPRHRHQSRSLRCSPERTSRAGLHPQRGSNHSACNNTKRVSPLNSTI